MKNENDMSPSARGLFFMLALGFYAVSDAHPWIQFYFGMVASLNALLSSIKAVKELSKK